MTDEQHILSPGNLYTWRHQRSDAWVEFDAFVRRPPLAVHDITERLLVIQKQGRTPKRVFVSPDLWKHLKRQVGPFWKETVWRKNRAKHFILGVPVSITRGKVPFYVLDDKGTKL